ncbi:filamentous hemagglutinin N-terminal domain-containing protein [Chamaesiphon sp. OTE_75_metabat_556]|uniref:two-partner secretion domain-containing protein n=1 Tax=Chamaesiphon sp. OTE_75_metabat_556 TaxID=2964692 RepID=UPI00286BD06D|nr:filamentous hemagglutinin N-terminal domain-containing protein [Chamaesiphon sp. OTE_75_metabat_556]
MKTKFLLSFLALVGLVFAPTTTHAQTYQPSNRAPVADNTLGTQVSGTGNNFNITGGVSKGQTLFQSFSDFSVPTNGQANFLNPAGNRDIITRVTGNLFSDINGTVNTNGANFFLINPNGIVFGNNARLDVGKAFVGSTANSIDLVNGSGGRITFGTNLSGDALLKVAPNVLFDISRLNLGGGNGAISNFGTLQTPNNSQYIGLIGGNVTLDGSMGGGKITAPGGRVDIGGFKGAGTVTIDNNGFAFGGTGLQRSDVSLIDGASISVRATGTLDTVNTFFNNATANGSSLNITTDNLDLLNAGANLSTLPAAIDAGLETNSGVQTQPGGNINIDATGKVSLNNSAIKNTLRSGAAGSIGDITIQANALDIINNAGISTSTAGTGNGGDINIKTTGDIKVSGYDLLSTDLTRSSISSDTFGQGNAGKVSIDTQGKLSIINNGGVSSAIGLSGGGNSKGVSITAGELELANLSDISTQVDGKGNAGDINVKTTGDIKISGSDLSSANPTLSQITSSTTGQGDTGKITIDTQGKLSLTDRGFINSQIGLTGVGNSQGISITARELELANSSYINTITLQAERVDGKGNAGDIKIETTGDIKVSGYDPSAINPTTSGRSEIASTSLGKGDAGKIAIDTQGKLSIVNSGNINSYVNVIAAGNSKGIKINARELELLKGSNIATATVQFAQIADKGNAGDIEVKTIGDIKLAEGSSFNSSTYFQGNAGKIEIETQGKFSLSDRSSITSTIGSSANGNGRDISIAAREIELNNSYMINGTEQITQVNGNGKSGDIILQAKDTISFKNVSAISTRSSGVGAAGNVSITAAQLLLDNSGLLSDSTSVSGGNVTVALSDKFLLRNGSSITTSSGSSQKNGNGGNITISSPLIIALSGNNDIIADANGGNGGNINITSQGLFGINYRAIGSNSTNDITASSNFGQNGAVNIDIPGTDPGKNNTELPQVPTDASNQISQVCAASSRENKLTVAGRGGLPPNADDLLTPNIVWRDARATNSQPRIGAAKTPAQLAPPAVGWLLDGKGKVTLVAAATNGQQAGTSVVCPQAAK